MPDVDITLTVIRLNPDRVHVFYILAGNRLAIPIILANLADQALAKPL